MSSKMIRKDIYITEEQESFLKELHNITVSEHIRRAIDEYITRKLIEKNRTPVTTSPSKHVG